MGNEEFYLGDIPLPEKLDADIDSWDPRLSMENERLTPLENLKEVRINLSAHQVTKIDISLTKEEEHELVDQLIRNVDLFA